MPPVVVDSAEAVAVAVVVVELHLSGTRRAFRRVTIRGQLNQRRRRIRPVVRRLKHACSLNRADVVAVGEAAAGVVAVEETRRRRSRRAIIALCSTLVGRSRRRCFVSCESIRATSPSSHR